MCREQQAQLEKHLGFLDQCWKESQVACRVEVISEEKKPNQRKAGMTIPTPPHRWVNSLQPARVTRWGGMISTPDAVLQAVIKRSLVESGCPASIVNELIENAHERSWPQGLATLETRQMNRRYYENYVAKRIPGKQAVVVMACENQHMGDDMVQEPGLVMIFAHGVEEI